MRACKLGLYTTLAGLWACGVGLQPSGGQRLSSDPTGGKSSDARKAKPSVACKDGETVYAVVPDSAVYWVVVKEGNVPVVGTHVLEGTLTVASGKPLSLASLALDFDTDGPLTNLALRDDRLRKYIFGADDDEPLRFVLKTASSKVADALAALPAAGTTIPLTLSGNLQIAGRSIAVKVPILLTGTEGGLEVAEGEEGVSLDLAEDLGLGEQVDQLLALVNKRLEDGPLRLHFHFFLANACK